MSAAYNSHEVAVYDSTGSYLHSFTAPGLNGPRGIVVNPVNGMIYVASQLSNEIFVFNAEEQHIAIMSDLGAERSDGNGVK